jgi:hypothetical protein
VRFPERARYAPATNPLWPPPMTMASYVFAGTGVNLSECFAPGRTRTKHSFGTKHSGEAG